MARLRGSQGRTIRSNWSTWIGVGSVALLLIILGGTGVLSPVRGFFLGVFQPGLAVSQSAGESTDGFFSTLKNIGSLPRRYGALEQEVQELRAREVLVEELERENALLREQLGFVERSTFETLPAFVIGQPPFAEFQFVVIDKGSSEGVEEGQAVVLSDGLLVGRVFSVTDSTAQVLLVTDANSAVPVVVQGSRANGIVNGDRGLGLRLSSVLREAEVSVDDRVVTTGLAGQYPKGLLVGTIEEVFDPGNDVFREARVRPAVDTDQLEVVFVITSS